MLAATVTSALVPVWIETVGPTVVRFAYVVEVVFSAVAVRAVTGGIVPPAVPFQIAMTSVSVRNECAPTGGEDHCVVRSAAVANTCSARSRVSLPQLAAIGVL